MELLGTLEALLFVVSKPMSMKQLAKELQVIDGKIVEAVETLQAKYNGPDSGIHLLVSDEQVQMATNPDAQEVTSRFVKKEVTGELTRAQLETLTVVAYMGPITRPELEQIRGVNCSVILRNLSIRDLIVEVKGANALMPSFQLSMNALAHLGIQDPNQLPSYLDLHNHEFLTRSQQVSSS